MENCFCFCCNLGQIDLFPTARFSKQMIFWIYSLLNIIIYSDQPGYCRFNAASVLICVPPCPLLPVVHVRSPGVISPLNRSKHFLGSYFPGWASKQWLILLCSGLLSHLLCLFCFFVANCERKRWREHSGMWTKHNAKKVWKQPLDKNTGSGILMQFLWFVSPKTFAR